MNVVISQRSIKDLKAPRTGNRIIYDSQIRGFGVRVTAAEAISFILTYWIDGRQRRFTIGRHPELTASAARAEAVQLRELIRRGGDPLAEKRRRYAAPTMDDLARDYLERHAQIHKRAGAAKDDEGMLRNIVLPKLGKLKVVGVERRDIEELQHKLRDMPYRANRVLALLSKMMNLAIDWGWRTDNPCRRIPRFQEEKRDRWLSTEELERLCAALDKHPNQVSANAVRLLLLTGARRGEVLSARWEDFDLERGIWTKRAITQSRSAPSTCRSAPALCSCSSTSKSRQRPRYCFRVKRPASLCEKSKSSGPQCAKPRESKMRACTISDIPTRAIWFPPVCRCRSSGGSSDTRSPKPRLVMLI